MGSKGTLSCPMASPTASETDLVRLEAFHVVYRERGKREKEEESVSQSGGYRWERGGVFIKQQRREEKREEGERQRIE